MKSFQKYTSLILFFILIISLFPPYSISASPPILTGGARCTAKVQNVYSAPNIASLVIGVLNSGDRILVYESPNEDWTCILFDGLPGYVPTGSLSIASDLNGPFKHTGVPELLLDNVRLLAHPGNRWMDHFSGRSIPREDCISLHLLGISGEWLEVSANGSTGFLHSSFLHFTGDNDLHGVTASPYVPITETSQVIWDFFLDKGLSPEAAAGLLGNLYAESALNTINLENAFEEKLGYSDYSYTYAVDHQTYSRESFINDQAGYGLCQWTSTTRKKELYDMAKDRKVSVSDLNLQLDIIWEELTDEHAYFLEFLSNSLTLKQASDAAMYHYMIPSIQNTYIEDMRLSYTLSFYEAFELSK